MPGEAASMAANILGASRAPGMWLEPATLPLSSHRCGQRAPLQIGEAEVQSQVTRRGSSRGRLGNHEPLSSRCSESGKALRWKTEKTFLPFTKESL